MTTVPPAHSPGKRDAAFNPLQEAASSYATSGLPDFNYIRKNVSIVEVARALGLSVNGSSARCWRGEAHRNGDADPSIRFWKKKNAGQCFVCDNRTWSNIDLVMQVRSCGLREATSWIASRFSVPSLPKGAHVKEREAWCPRFRASDSAGDVLATIVRSGLFASFSHAERSILTTLSVLIGQNSESSPISYRGLMRYSGVGSQATIAAALRNFERMGFLRIIRNKAEGPFRGVSSYCFTVDDPAFEEIVHTTFQRDRDEDELEKQLQSEARKSRSRNAALCR